jgi:TolB-like protein
VGKAVQQDLLTDLTQGTSVRVYAPASATPAADSDEALKAGRDAGASVVIYGQAQNTGREVRLSGQVLDVATAKSIGALKATGPSDDLFHLEDALAGQVFIALPHELLTGRTLQGVQNAMTNAQQPGAAPQQPQQGNGGNWPNGPYAAPTVNDNSIYGQTQPAAPPVAPQPQYDPGTAYDNYQSVPTYAYPDYGYYPVAPYDGYSDHGAFDPYWGSDFYVSPGWAWGYGGFGHGFRGHDHDRDGDFRGGEHGEFRGGEHGGFSRTGAGHSFGGVGRLGASGHVGVGSSGGFHSNAFSSGAARSGSFGGSFRGGAFRSSGGFHGAVSHGGGFAGGGAHASGGFSMGGHGGGGGGGHR